MVWYGRCEIGQFASTPTNNSKRMALISFIYLCWVSVEVLTAFLVGINEFSVSCSVTLRHDTLVERACNAQVTRGQHMGTGS